MYSWSELVFGINNPINTKNYNKTKTASQRPAAAVSDVNNAMQYVQVKVVLGSCTLYIRIYIYVYLYIYVYGYITISAIAAGGTTLDALPGTALTAGASNSSMGIGVSVLPGTGSAVMYTMFTAL